MRTASGRTIAAKTTPRHIADTSSLRKTKKMLLTLCRKPSTEHYTEGELFLGEQKLCDTLEDVVRQIKNRADKVIGYTAIPKGKYRVLWTYSPKYKRFTPELQQVPWFSAIRIHAGNTAEDTRGCILVGRKGEEGQLILSRLTTENIYNLISRAIMKKEPVYITIS